MNEPALHDVIVVGAGPVGLLLAAELRLAGVSVLVLEKAADPEATLKGLPFGMRGLSIPTVEILHRRGLLEALNAVPGRQGSVSPDPASPAAHGANQARRPGGHFAGIQFFQDRVDPSKWPFFVSGPASAPVVTTMAEIEAVLTTRATALGADIRRGVPVDAVAESDDRVEVRAGAETFQACWLVGCDGGRSAVRKLAGFEFAGTEPEFTGYSVEVGLADPGRLPAGRQHTPSGVYTFQPPGAIAMVDFDAGAAHRQPVTLEHVQSVLRRVSGTEATVESMTSAATWTDRAFQATTYRRGRVLLAGDAAHIHSPLGGQGLNLGLGDAMNLGWKLAAIVRGDARDDLLDTYGSERHPIGARVLDWSRAQVALMRPTASSHALGAIVRDLIDTPDGATYFADRVWSATLRHDLGGGHPLVGRSIPDFELDAGRRLADVMRAGRGVVLEFGAATLQDETRPWTGRLEHLSRSVDARFGLRAILVRPDGVVAWATDAEPIAAEFIAAAVRWFGDSIGSASSAPSRTA